MATPTRAATFRNPLMANGPDPWLLFHDGFYYLCATNGHNVRIRKAAHIGQLHHADDIIVWTDRTPGRSKQMWAAEFHFLDGPNGRRWYVYYTASDGVDDHHRIFVIEADQPDGTPLGPYHYKGQLKTDPDDKLYGIDPDVFVTSTGKQFLLWAGHPGHVLFIQQLENPWTTTGQRTQIPASGFGCAQIREGPCGMVRDGKVFLLYSACDTGLPDYKVCMLIANENSDLLDPKSWVQHPAPVFTRCDAHGVYGPGHNGIFKSPDGTEDWIVYHAKTVSRYTYTGRSTRAQKFTWKNGLPDFGEPIALDQDIPVPSGDLT
jgi:GH43 family beta-xylosidase